MKVVEFTINEEAEDYGVFAISLVEQPAIEENFKYFSKEGRPKNFATVDKDKRIVMGAVMIPDIQILRIDQEGNQYKCFFSKETIKRVSELYMLESKHKNATLEHERVVNGITTVESWIVSDSKKDKTQAFGLEYPVGTWVACMKIDNEDVWQNYVKEGIVKGFSIEGYFDEKPTNMSQESILEQIREIIREDENKTL